MDEILYELRDHSAGLNCGRWDYMFSFIKKFRNHPRFVLPNRGEVTMDAAFPEILCGAADPDLPSPRIFTPWAAWRRRCRSRTIRWRTNRRSKKFAQDKLREVKAGHDGTWVAHPGLVPVAKEIFDEYMKDPNQIFVKREDVHVTAKDLLEVPGRDHHRSRPALEYRRRACSTWKPGCAASAACRSTT